MRIGVIAPPWMAVPPPVYGGTERVVDCLARALVRLGHDVVLFATGDSTCPVPRRWLYERAAAQLGDIVTELGHVRAAHVQLADVDVLHDHTLLGPLWAMAEPPGPPIVTTAHGPLTGVLEPLFARLGRQVPVVAVSASQRDLAPCVPVAAVIHHGIDVDDLPLGAGDDGHLLFLGRMSADKGVHRAIAVARAAGRRLVLAAKMREPAEHRYFREQVEPHLGPGVTFVGEVGGAQKVELLAGATALLNPIRWPEPFGMVMVEALAVGTPVLAFPEGAAPEIVRHGCNGFLCTDESDMAARVADVATLDRATCRADAATRFSADRMAADHVALFQRVLGGDLVERVVRP